VQSIKLSEKWVACPHDSLKKKKKKEKRKLLQGGYNLQEKQPGMLLTFGKKSH
jgi:hypothetical protein